MGAGAQCESFVPHHWCNQFRERGALGGGAHLHRTVGHNVDHDEEREERQKTL